MTSEFKNFVSFRKTRGDILHPATFRSAVAMIQGMIKQYDFADFNAKYQDFLNHLNDHDDPHRTILTDFFPQIAERTYGIYVLMTGTPMSQEDFEDSFVKTPGFLELLRRITLNRYIYNQIKNPDGSVNATVSVNLGPDWHPVLAPNTPVTVSFGRVLTDETDFIRSGWQQATTPQAVVFTAANLDPEEPLYDEVFHTSVETPYFDGTGTANEYLVGMDMSSNDFRVHVLMDGTPTANKVVCILRNLTQTLTVSYTTAGKVSVKLGNTLLGSELNCKDRRFWLTFSHPSSLSIKTENDGVFSTSTFSLGGGSPTPYTQLQVMLALTSPFTPAVFGLRELTVQRLRG